MAKPRTVFVCRACGGVQQRWIGKCPDCGAWGALEQETVDRSASRDPQRGLIEAWQGAIAHKPGPGGAGVSAEDTLAEAAAEVTAAVPAATTARPMSQIQHDADARGRISTGIGELDRVLGGGLVAGSVVLVGGDPGIGKSTLMLQAAGKLAAGRGDQDRSDHAAPAKDRPAALEGSGQDGDCRVLYVSSEESAEQVRMRAQRLGVGGEDNLYVLADTNLARIVEQVRRVLPRVLVIDSVQMIYKADLPASPGSVAQLRRCCAELVYLAKVSGIAIVLVGHVTKDGQLAGPRLLEHLVDAVLYFEGDRYHAHRVLRGVKNRFGTTLEIGVFEMTGQGLREAAGGLGASLLESLGHAGKRKVGSAICPVVTGTRCMLVELQALTATSFLGSAKRKSSGLDANRLAMIIAVLEQHAELRLADRDVFASSAHGIRVVEPAADLAVLIAIAGAHYRRALEPGTAAIGEVGLGGEVRAVTQIEMRVAEAARLGCRRLLVPASQARAARSALRSVVESRTAGSPRAYEEASARSAEASRERASPPGLTSNRARAEEKAAGGDETGPRRLDPASAQAEPLANTSVGLAAEPAPGPARGPKPLDAELKPAHAGKSVGRDAQPRCEIVGVDTILRAIEELT
jgi:DNA repair protein RadA/Sms